MLEESLGFIQFVELHQPALTNTNHIKNLKSRLEKIVAEPTNYISRRQQGAFSLHFINYCNFCDEGFRSEHAALHHAVRCDKSPRALKDTPSQKDNSMTEADLVKHDADFSINGSDEAQSEGKKMKIGDRYDLRSCLNRDFVQEIVDKFGVSKDINQVGSSVLCRDDHGKLFELVTMHRTPHIVAVCSATTAT